LILVAWIVIQVSIIDSIHRLHVSYFAIGLVELAADLKNSGEKGAAYRRQGLIFQPGGFAAPRAV
jgi:hypothetical protein